MLWRGLNIEITIVASLCIVLQSSFLNAQEGDEGFSDPLPPPEVDIPDSGPEPAPLPPPAGDGGDYAPDYGGGSGYDGAPGFVPQLLPDDEEPPEEQSLRKSSPSKSPEPDAEIPYTLPPKRRIAKRDTLHRIRLFGPWRLNIGSFTPRFSKGDAYKKFYGRPEWGYALGVDWLPLDWFATLGLTFRANYYKDYGRALILRDGQLVKDELGKIELTLIPLQAGIIMEATPFTKKWVVLSGWAGYEALFYQEVRTEDDTESEDETSEDTVRPYVNKGWVQGMTFGGAFSLRLDALDARTSASLRNMNMQAIYLTPYFEMVRKSGSGKIDFSRSVYGISMTFESI